jgi:cullin 1
MCIQKTPYNWSEQLYALHGETIATYLQVKALQSLKSKLDEFLLGEFVQRGKNHQLMNKWCTNFFIYLDRYHVKYQQLPTLNDAGMKKYKQIVYDSVKKDVTASILRMIKEEREGNVVDRDLIKRCVDIYVKMGMGNVDAYETDFEQSFLEASREFYRSQPDGWIVSDSTPSYLLKIEKILNDEKSRVNNYLVFTPETN